MRYPPRLSHLATRQVLAAKLLTLYTDTHQLEDEEARERLLTALGTPLLDDVLAATWTAMLGTTKRLDEAGLVEKVSRTLGDRPLRVGRKLEATPALSAFLIQVDLAANTASDAVRKVLESEQGRVMARKGLEEAGKYLAAELTRG